MAGPSCAWRKGPHPGAAPMTNDFCRLSGSTCGFCRQSRGGVRSRSNGHSCGRPQPITGFGRCWCWSSCSWQVGEPGNCTAATALTDWFWRSARPLPPRRKGWWKTTCLRIVAGRNRNYALATDASVDPELRLRASLACLPEQVDYLSQRLLDCSVDEFPVIRNRVQPYNASLLANLWTDFRNPKLPDEARFHAGMALTAYAAESPDWNDADADYLTRQLLVSNPDVQRKLLVSASVAPSCCPRSKRCIRTRRWDSLRLPPGSIMRRKTPPGSPGWPVSHRLVNTFFSTQH